ncbi:MAG: hypothetical protein KBT88_02620 [Gammaproteobacteria bacterium]|nr:hypothetical protein [Gammaproteobacteria bacterium]MBQ0838650.1 hypothetical protein [Gammaproteobacteria bacterium]
MYSDEDLASAVKAGVLSSDAVTALRQHVAELRKAPAVDDEHFRFITGFNDIFVVIACALLLVSVQWIGTAIAPWVGAFLQAASAWALAEYFARVRRMALPSIVLLLAFVGGVAGGGIMLLKSLGLAEELGIGLGCALGAGAAWLHWLRFKVPITVAAGMAALVFALVATFAGLFPGAKDWWVFLVFIGGVLVFITGMRWDASDTQRQTRRSDVAFWLHLVAAPLMVHPIFSLVGAFDYRMGLGPALAIAGLYGCIALVSISIDRRALMVSALAYVLYAFNTLLQEYGVVSLSFAFAALTIGGALLLMSAFWHNCRAFILGFYPPAVCQRLPPLH